MFLSTGPHEDLYFRFCCGFHAHNYALFTALLDLTGAFIFACVAYWQGLGYLIPFIAIATIPALFLVYGNRRWKWWAYIPYLCQIASTLASVFFSSLAMVVYGLFLLAYDYYYVRSERDRLQTAGVALAVLLVGVLGFIVLCVQLYFAHVFVRAFQFIREERPQRSPMKPLPEYY